MIQSHSVQKIWTISNILSLSRIFFVAPVVYYLDLARTDPRYNLMALLFIILGSVTDTLDGLLARRFNQVTEFGKIIDPLADKIGMAIVILYLAVSRDDFPLWFFSLLAGRDVLIFSAGLYVKKKHNHLFVSNLLGKTTVTVIALMVCVYAIKDVYGLSDYYRILLWISAVLLVASFFSYVYRFIQFVQTIRR